MRNAPLEHVNETKVPGIIVDNKLSFKGPVDTLRKKMFSAIGAMKRAGFFLPDSVANILYFYLIYPRLFYVICV